MAKDVQSKSTSNSNTDDNSSSAIPDQQKVPPLRIVLNTSGNQKSSSSAIAVPSNQQQQQQQQPQSSSDKTHDGKGCDSVVRTGGRVRIKLGTNKQVRAGSHANEGEGSGQGKSSKQQENNSKEEINASFGHLRRITRRSQRSAQTVTNEDEESKSSMTSIDENQTTTNNTTTNNLNSDNTNSQDNNASSQQQAAASSNSGNQASAGAGAVPATAEPARKYKRRRGETSESQSCDHHDTVFGYQSTYRSPGQNSIELFRNIRKQVDKRLKNLSNVHLKSPHGFRDYMLSRGAYLLEGNKLGNGTNLYVNDEGGLHTVPIGKYHALTRHNRVNYSVPNRAKVPLGLPINSPLYNLFIEQEKERYRMQIQHIKEREKLTLAAEQEMIRVHNQATMAAANQLEPFSACTMLKHQEIYNYMDSEGVTILSNEDAERDRVKQPAGGTHTGATTRTRSREYISPNRPSNNHHNNNNNTHASSKEESNTVSATSAASGDKKEEDKTSTSKQQQQQPKSEAQTNTLKDESQDNANNKTSAGEDETSKSASKSIEETPMDVDVGKHEESSSDSKDETAKLTIDEKEVDSDSSKETVKKDEKSPPVEQAIKEPDDGIRSKETEETPKPDDTVVKIEPSEGDELATGKQQSEPAPEREEEGKLSDEEKSVAPKTTPPESSQATEKSFQEAKATEKDEPSQGEENVAAKEPDAPLTQASGEADPSGQTATASQQEPTEEVEKIISGSDVLLTDEDRKVYNKNIFVSQLQVIDDKWEKIKREMLIRHRNEADSLYAVQKLEWEWKTKEIGACDVRTTPIIDNTLVPKLNIYTQDY